MNVSPSYASFSGGSVISQLTSSVALRFAALDPARHLLAFTVIPFGVLEQATSKSCCLVTKKATGVYSIENFGLAWIT